MRTPLYDEHIRLNAKMVDFHGWDMPIQYTSIIEEHRQVRQKAGVFDVSHMGDIMIEGKDAQDYLSYLLPTNFSKSSVGKAIYSAYMNKNAEMIDDTIANKISEEKFLVVPNAATTDKIYEWLIKNKNDFKVKITNISFKMSCLALQGPLSHEVMEDIYPEANKLEHFAITNVSRNYPSRGLEDATMISSTGYTGEEGFEFIIPNEFAVATWRKIISNKNVKPIGLGARDTLRMEKGFLLSGQDFNEDRDPIEAGVSWIIDWDHDFIGKVELEKRKENVKKRFRGVIAEDRIIPRNGSVVNISGKQVGILTSGTFSPSLNKGIGLGYIDSDVKLETEIEVSTRTGTGKGRIKKPRLV